MTWQLQSAFQFLFLFSTPTFHIHPLRRVSGWEYPCLAVSSVWQSPDHSPHRSGTEDAVPAPKLLEVANLGVTKECPHLSSFSCKSGWFSGWYDVGLVISLIRYSRALHAQQSKAISSNGQGHCQPLGSAAQPCRWNLCFDIASLTAIFMLWLTVVGCKAAGFVVEGFYLQCPAGSCLCWSSSQVILSIGSVEGSSLIINK